MGYPAMNIYKQSIRVIQLFLFSMIVIHSYIHDIHSNCTGSHADPQGECSMTNSELSPQIFTVSREIRLFSVINLIINVETFSGFKKIWKFVRK